MPLQTTDEIIVKAEIKAALFMRAFEELAKELSQRDQKAFEAAGSRIGTMLQSFSVTKFYPPGPSVPPREALQAMRVDGLQEALEAFHLTVRRIVRSKK